MRVSNIFVLCYQLVQVQTNVNAVYQNIKLDMSSWYIGNLQNVCV